jgi:hypothetical protein
MWANLLWKGGPVPKAVPTAPPVTEKQVEVRQADTNARRIMRKKKGMLSTILAGETGGTPKAASPVGTKSILGPGGY